MKKTLFWALIGLNVVLLVAFLGRAGLLGENAAHAQNRPRPGEFVMIPGEIPGGNNGVVYVIDVTNGLLGAMAYDEPRRELNAMEPIDIGRVFEEAAGGGGVRRGGNRGGGDNR